MAQMLEALVELFSLIEGALVFMISLYKTPRFNLFCCLWKFKSYLLSLSGKISRL